MIDTHVHFTHKKFDCGREEIIERLHEEGKLDFAVEAAIDFTTNEKMIKGLKKYPWISYGVGIHPKFVGESDEVDATWMASLSEYLKHPKTVAVGETGLDYHMFETMSDAAQKECITRRQKEWFRRSIELSLESGLPLILHIREADEDALAILREYQFSENPGVVHCFGKPQFMQEYLDMGFSLGIGGRITYEEEEELREALKTAPMERLLLETDSPFVKPLPAEGSRNTPENLCFVVDLLAKLRGIPCEELIEITDRNAKSLFKIGK